MKSPTKLCGFTLVELITVIVIICVLMGLIFAAIGGVNEGARRRLAASQIAAFTSAMETYKADHGTYPMGPAGETDSDPRLAAEPSGAGSLYLYKELSGDTDASFSRNTPEEKANKVYLDFETRRALIHPKEGSSPGTAGYVEGISDPWGNFYGYSTLRAKLIQDGNTNPAAGYNPTFDMWSTAKSPGEPQKWVVSW
jgi:prepilin-type N-terminal cleavage/methylation domain-containing protein